jgi:hypothetical protein
MRHYALAFIVMIGFIAAANAQDQDRTFGGYSCTDECEGHSAGFKWAQSKDIDDASHRPYGNSQSFHEGCLAYTEDPDHDPDEDDDGNPVGVPVVPPSER